MSTFLWICVYVHREATSRMKEGEEEKTKSYSALIWTQKPITPVDLDFFKNIKVFKLHYSIPWGLVLGALCKLYFLV